MEAQQRKQAMWIERGEALGTCIQKLFAWASSAFRQRTRNAKKAPNVSVGVDRQTHMMR